MASEMYWRANGRSPHRDSPYDTPTRELPRQAAAGGAGGGDTAWKPVRRRAMIAFSLVDVTNFTSSTGGLVVEHPGQDVLMASQPLESSAAQVSPWSACTSTCNRSYLVAGMRATVIALVLLGILALVVLF